MKRIKSKQKNMVFVFISYSWDNKQHKKWVKVLADKLIKNGINIILDHYDLHTGMDKNSFMENSIKKSKKVLLILTPNYAKKADKRKGGVGHEYSIIDSEISDNITQMKKYIPILRRGSDKTSCPMFLKQLIFRDMRKESNFKTEFEGLLCDIYDKHPIKPPVGDIPVRFINKKIILKTNG